MSDEENINDTIDTSDEVTQDPSGDPTQDVPENTPSEHNPITYCTVTDVTDLFGSNIPDTTETSLIEGGIRRATARIHNGLRARNVPLPDPEDYSSAINAIATYYAACDCYGSLYNGEDYQTEQGHWCREARQMLDEYCDAYWNSCAEEDEQIKHNLVKHSHARTYNQKRGRRGVRRWVR